MFVSICEGRLAMYRPIHSGPVVLRGKKGREIFEKILNTKPKPFDHEKKAAELKKQLERQGMKL